MFQTPGIASASLTAVLQADGVKIVAIFDVAMKAPVDTQKRMFSVQADGTPHTITDLQGDVDNEMVYHFTAETPIAFGKQVTLSYARGTVQAQNKAYLSSFIDRLVINTVPPPAPRFIQAQTNTSGDQVHVLFDREMADPSSRQTHFFLTATSTIFYRNGIPITQEATLSADRKTIILSVDPQIRNGENWQLNYTKPVSENDQIKSEEGLALESFQNKPIDNMVPGIAPILLSALLQTNGTTIVATFDKTMKVPTLTQKSQFSVRADGIAQLITNLQRDADDERVYHITVQTPITFGKQVALSYVKGSVQAQNDAYLESFTDRLVTNNVPPPAPPPLPPSAPQFIRAWTNTLGNQVHVLFDQQMADPSGKHHAFTLSKISGVLSRSSITPGEAFLSADLKTIILTVEPKINNGENWQLSYAKPEEADDQVKSEDGEALESFQNKPIDNMVPGETPILLTAVLETNGIKIVAAFDKDMKEPEDIHKTQFAVKADGIDQTIETLVRDDDNDKVYHITLGASVTYGKQVTLSYTKGTVQALNDAYLASFFDRLVTNNVPPPPLDEIELVYPDAGQEDVELNPHIRWKHFPGASTYELFLQEITPVSGRIASRVEVSVPVLEYWPDGPLLMGRTYEWKVIGKNSQGEEVAESATRTFSTTDKPVWLWRNGELEGRFTFVSAAVMNSVSGDTISIERGVTIEEPDAVWIEHDITLTATPVHRSTDRATITRSGDDDNGLDREEAVLGFLDSGNGPAGPRDAKISKIQNLDIFGYAQGFGIIVDSRPPDLQPVTSRRRVIIRDSDITYCGGGIFGYHSFVQLESVTISDNDGFGGIFAVDSFFMITDNSIIVSNHHAESEEQGFPNIGARNGDEEFFGGGGITAFSSMGFFYEVWVIDSQIEDNTTYGYGGGLHLHNYLAVLTNTHISNNSAEKGGGVFLGGDSILNADSDTVINNNLADEEGGGIYKDRFGSIFTNWKIWHPSFGFGDMENNFWVIINPSNEAELVTGVKPPVALVSVTDNTSVNNPDTAQMKWAEGY